MPNAERARLLFGSSHKQCPDPTTTMVGDNEQTGQPRPVLQVGQFPVL
jgi:hypothetical protein